MTPTGLNKVRQLSIVGLILGLLASTGLAGNGPYDPDKKTFSLTYIYLDLPSLGQGQALTSNSEGEVKLSRSTTGPNDQQKADVTRFWNLVSDRLKQITGNRGALGSISEVNDIEKADAVISLTGNVRPAGYGGAWAQPGGWCQGGTLNIYYQDLFDDDAEDVVETVVHELCHYLFGLPDEYRAGSAPGLLCPLDASKGCLMDNFHQGWNGRLCTRDDHNPRAPGANGFPAITDPSLSCQEVLDSFFANLKAGPATTNTPVVVSSAPRTIPAATRNRVMGKARKTLLARLGQLGGVVTAEIRKELTMLVASELDKAKVGGLDQAVPKLVEDAIFTALPIPAILKPIAEDLTNKALELARKIIDPKGKALAIETHLLNLVKSEIGSGKKLGAAPALGENEAIYIKTLARRTAEGSSLIAENVVKERRLADRLKTRSTVIIEPPILVYDPTKPTNLSVDQVVTQGLPDADYNELRKLNGSIFANLIDRRQMLALSATSSADDSRAITVGLATLNSTDSRKVFAIDTTEGKTASVGAVIDTNLANAVYQKRKDRLAQIIKLAKEQIEQDKVANVVVLIPPGGLSNDFDAAFEDLATAFIGKAELRLDIAVVGSSPIPTRLRDFVTRTNGSILTVTDSDEVGAVAQRLAGEQTQGTWISIPQQDMLILPGSPPVADDGAKVAEPAPPAIPGIRPLYERLERNRMSHPIQEKGRSQVVLRPVYLDASTDYEMIFGMTQGIMVPGVSSFKLKDQPVPLLKSNSPDFFEPEMHLVAGEIRGDAIAKFEASTDLPAYSWTPNLKLDPARSTDTSLVFHLPVGTLGGIAGGWYTPVLVFDSSNFRPAVAGPIKNVPSESMIKYHDNKIHFTFSVGTQTTTGQLVASLIQDLPNTPSVQDHGTIDPRASKVVVAAVLSAGSGVIDAEVRGFLQKIDIFGRGDIMTFPISFNDDGTGDDKVGDDGIYTAVISLETPRSSSAEYRLFVDGRSIKGKSKFVPVGEALPPDSDARTTTPPANPLAPTFQRATSINFYVPASNPL